ncbi:hypothetical protein BBF96_05720 [Anoxybacter fermentans]|uniref:DUF4097 domain-containing protein n=1 Tax=Anoxybacter fermentans TaxID=1323375 RepID=A0A3Q9HPZ5_9FIRM|nr:DUF4097 family beta strand repeat-containing protein [Anoxybacter fermentans]AZR72933.1 hypothetical protein BBF96_05720 [Anoxybacter fermentans]
MRKKYLTVVVLLALVGLVAGCIGLGRYEGKQTLMKKISAREEFVLQTFNGYVTIASSEDDNIHLEITKMARGDDQAKLKEFLEKEIYVDLIENDSKVEVKVKRPSFFPLSIMTAGVNFKVKIPNSTVSNINNKTSNDFVEVKDFSRRINVVSSNGHIELENVNGIMDVVTSNGRVTGNDIAGIIAVESKNGFINIEASDQGLLEVTLSTSNSSIIFRSPIDINGTYNLKTSNGRIIMEVPSDSKMDVTAETSNGSISCELQHTKRLLTDDIIKLIVNGGGAIVNLETSNSDIEIRGW